MKRNYADAADSAKRAVENDPSDADAYFELARAEALRGNGGSAEDALSKALDHGLADAGQKLDDPAFTSIRNDQAFARLVDRATPAGATSRAEVETPPPAVELGDKQIRAGDVVLNTDF